jgi:hypothetical protein
VIVLVSGVIGGRGVGGAGLELVLSEVKAEKERDLSLYLRKKMGLGFK